MMQYVKDLSWNERVGYAFGAVYVLIGVVGFAVTSGVGFAASQGKELIFFELNPLHNLVHIAIGLTLVLAARAGGAKLMNGLVGGTYLVVGAAGLFLVGGTAAHPLSSTFPGLLEGGGNAANILALNHPDNALHFASAVVLLGVALLLDRRLAAPGTGSESEHEDTHTEAEAAGEGEDAEIFELPRGAKVGGDKVGATGAYSCACGNFAVLIKKGMIFPDCPSRADDDHYYARSKKKSAAKKSA